MQVVLPDKEQGGKKIKNGEVCICPVCLDEIIETTNEVERHDAILCEGVCQTFIHRHCAGLCKPLFKAFQVLDRPFQCANCCNSQYESLLTSMKSTVTTLEKRVEELESAIFHQTAYRLQ